MGNYKSNWARRRTDPCVRLALLGGVSLIASGIVLGRAPAAHAEQVPTSTASTVNSNGTGIFVNPNVNLTGAPGINNSTVTGTIYSLGTIVSDESGVANSGTIGNLTNAAGGTILSHNIGTIANDSNGVYNSAGSIGTLTNNGLIEGTAARGVQNQGGTIGLLTNSGTITGRSGIAAQTGIGTIINEDGGTISATGDLYGIYINAHVDLLQNDAGGTISSVSGTGVEVQSHALSTLTNSGLITGTYGVGNSDGTIGALFNAGTIFGTVIGVYNDNHTGTLANLNGGTISGSTAILNNIQAHIGTLSNDAGGLIKGVVYGVFNAAGTTDFVNQGTIGTLSNSGVIMGNTAIYNEGHLGTLFNETGGTISGGVGIQNYYDGTIIPTIGNLSNATGALITADTTGIYNDGHIGTLTNNGVITAEYGIINDTGGTIGTLISNGVISGSSSGIDNYGVIHTLTNSGLIAADTSAIYNDGLINTLTNSGTILGEYGIGNADYEGDLGTIGAITNIGTVVGTEVGLINGGRIGAITNSGTIYGVDEAGLVNGGTVAGAGYIGTLSNLSTGTIAGYEAGVGNAGTIVDFTNAGLIEATATDAATIAGIYNAGTIDTLTNQDGGVIYGYYAGIDNNVVGTFVGIIDALTNNAGGTISGYQTGIENQTSIGTLTNSGEIYGTIGIYNAGHIGTLANTGTGTITGREIGIVNDGTIVSATNAGLITSGVEGEEGLDNTGTIGVFTNLSGGTISGVFAGVINEGTIGAFFNSGLVNGTDPDLYEYDAPDGFINLGIVSDLTNEAGGTISGYLAGVNNFFYGTIAALNNAGVISGGDYGVENYAVGYEDYQPLIGTLTNTGLISGGSTGVYNEGTIGALVNTGTITGSAYDGIYNSGTLYAYDDYAVRAQAAYETSGLSTGTIISLSNTGVISGGTAGIYNEGYIGTITNSGLITGGDYGIYNGYIGTVTAEALDAQTTANQVPAVIGQITNTGTISGATGIYLSGGGTTITNSGTIASTDGGNAIYFGGVDDLILTTGSVIVGTIDGGGTASQIALEGDGSLDNEIADFGPGSALAVTPGADWTATGNWTIASVINDGVFQPGRLGTPLTLTGDYLQNADGTMRVLVTPTTSTMLNITGSATLSGTVSYVLAPGHYSPHIYPYLTATDGVTGEFTTVNYGEIPKGLAATQYVEDPTVELVLSGSFNIPNIINPDDSTIFSAQTQALAQESDADTASLLEKAAYGGAATSPACAAEAPLSPEKTGAAGNSAKLASTLASVFCGAGGWIEATGSLGHADPSGGAPSYNANTAGFLAGVDAVASASGTRLGFAVGYDETYLSDKLGGGGRMGTTRVALYGAQPAGMFTLAGVLEYGNASNSTSRVSGDGNLSENNSVSIWSGGLQISTDVTMHGIDFVPAAGLRVASVGGGSHFAEGATGIATAFAVSGKTTQYNSVQPYVLVEGKQSFVTASGVTVTPDAEIGYEYEAGTHGIVTTLYGADGTVFYTPHNDLDPSDALLSAGIAASKNNWSLFATYTAHVAANWDTQMGEAGLRITF